MTDRHQLPTMGSGAMGKAPKERRQKKPRERWLLTRKTWRYMTDAGRRLIPDGAHNRAEDVPKIEAYFQEVCRKEPRFLLWRKASYPGALARPSRKRRERRLGSCRTKAGSADEADESTSPAFSPVFSPTLSPPPTSTKTFSQHFSTTTSTILPQSEDETLAGMLEQYLKISPNEPTYTSAQFDYNELIQKLQHHLSTIHERHPYRRTPSSSSSSSSIHESGHRALTETLSRYFSRTSNRERIISDVLTERKLLETLYFDLRKSKNFGSRPPKCQYRVDLLKDDSRYDTDDELEVVTEVSGEEKLLGVSTEQTGSVPPLIHVESVEKQRRNDLGTQTDSVVEEELGRCEQLERSAGGSDAEQSSGAPTRTGSRRRSSVENDDVSQSVSDTIKRYLRMARKKSSDKGNADRFKRINYDKNLRNIKAKNVVDMPSEDSFDGLSKGSQTDCGWVPAYRSVQFRLPSSECSSCDETPTSVVVATPHGLLHSGQVFLSQLLHGSHSRSAGPAAMQKSKSSSNVVQQATKRIFRSRSKSQSRLQLGAAQCEWTPRGDRVWGHVTRDSTVTLEDCNVLRLTDAERKALQQVALARLQALSLGVTVRAPPEPSAAVAAAGKSKRRAYLLRRKAKTTGFFESGKNTDGSTGSGGGLVFGIPLWQCIENDRLARLARPSELSGDEEPRRHGSRGSFSSLMEAPRNDESGSCESLSAGGVDEASPVQGGVPDVVEACVRQLEVFGLRTLGLFRVSSSRKRVRQLREEWDAGKSTPTVDGEEQCPHDVATLLKEYLRDLPEPLLCRDLYHPFLLTQRIRNRRLQLEALRYLIQLLPPPNRDTLHALLRLLASVAERSEDARDSSTGQPLPGNRMDSTNLATVFAPNILHCLKPGTTAPPADRPEERSDAINTVRSMIDHFQQLFVVQADTLHDAYLNLMDTHPELLDRLLTARENAQKRSLEETSGVVSWTTGSGESSEGQPEAQRRMWSREEFTHEHAGTGGPDVAMRLRHRDRSSKKRWRDESGTRRRPEEITTMPSAVVSKSLQQQYMKNRSSSVDSGGGVEDRTAEDRRQSSPLLLDNGAVITASLRIPVQQQPLQVDDSDIPYIEDGCPADSRKKQPAPPPRRSRYRSASGSDSSQASVSGIPLTASLQLGYDSAVGSSAVSSPPFSSVGSSSPPTSPDASTDRLQVTTQRLQFDVSPNAHLHKVTISSTCEVQQVSTSSSITKSSSTSTVQQQRRPAGAPVRAMPTLLTRPNVPAGGVLRSKTEDFGKIAEAAGTCVESVKTKTVLVSEKKKYTKRRYTDSRHETKHIPDSETLERERAPPATAIAPALYKRRELIASVPSKDRRTPL